MMNIRDLLIHGYLKVDDVIFWEQPRLNLKHFATIKSNGQLATTDGKIHRTPSGAARHYYNKPIDGWHNWRLQRTGQRLSDIREFASNK